MKPELLSVTLPVHMIADPASVPDRPWPEWWGRAVQAAFLSVIEQADASLSEQLHQENMLHPYTVSGLIGLRKGEAPLPDQSLQIRLTSASEDLSALLTELIQPNGLMAPGKRIILDYLPFQIQEAASPLIESCTFADLIAAGARDSEKSALGLRFVSPLVFKSEGKSNPMPLPGLVFQSLLRKWNAFAPLTFPEDSARFAAECLGISAFDLKSIPIPVKQSGLRIGSVGQIRYRALKFDRYWQSVLHSLCAFSPFSGTGSGTAFGLGQTRCPQTKK